MRIYLLSLCLFFSILSIAQKAINIVVPKDDGSPFSWPTKHLWVGRANSITSSYLGNFELLKVWTDNGSIEVVGGLLNDHAIVPAKPGVVNVYSIQKIWNGKRYDTIHTKNAFEAILPPKIFVKLKSDGYTRDTTISFFLIDSQTSKPIGGRYKIGRFYEPEILDGSGNVIGSLSMCDGTKININDPMHNTNQIRFARGYKLRFIITVRDMKTDLLIPTNEFVYTIR